ncbi:MAG: adenylate kinase [Bacteroidetes bacterium]|nr:adenylate kinase [Bacteroidota bacterium]
MLNLILFGPPGAGKGTHSIKLSEKYKLVHLSTGDIFRSEIANKTNLGLEAKSFIDKGKLVPDEVVLNMLFSFMDKHLDENGFVFDGFPRTIVQADKFGKMLEDRKISVSTVVSLEVNEEELITRLVKRGLASGRTDDTEEVIRHRLEVYNEQTKPLLEYYNKKNLLHTVYGVGSVDTIFEEICNVIEKNVKGKYDLI